MRKPTILQIGPLPLRGVETMGGMVAYVEGFLHTELPQKYDIRILDTMISPVFKKHRFLRIFLSFYFFIKLFWMLFTTRPEITHIHMSSGKKGKGFWEKSLFGLVCRIAGSKVIFHLHGANFNVFLFSGQKRHLIPKILFIANKNIVLSKNWYELFCNIVPKERLIVIPNAIDTKLYMRTNHIKRKNESIRILFVGSVSKRKGLIDLAKATYNLVKDGCTNFVIDILGDEEEYGHFSKIKGIYHDLKLKRYVVFHGPIFGEQKIKFYHQADIFVLPSYYESFGIVNLEAMAAGLPIISTRVGAVPEYITHEENGFLIDPGSIDQLTKFLKILITNDEMRCKMGRNNMQKVTGKFDWSIIAKQLDSLYMSFLS